MPRQPRQKSKTGFYHILLRGIGRQNIFEDKEDYQQFLTTITKYKKELKFELHSYCLMGNHVHLLLKEDNDELDVIMKKIACSYAYYFNNKYERVGHLFQDRYKSEVIEAEAYYLTVVRYIHQNPIKAGITKNCCYPWSSYDAFCTQSGIVETDFALDLLGGSSKFIEYLEAYESSNCLEVTNSNRITDEKAKEILKQKFRLSTFSSLNILEINKRNYILHELKKLGISIRQIERLSGINRGIIQRA